eukprot:293191-Alexandrium_andersonii.AAC.1
MGLPRVLASQRRSSASLRLSSASLALASLDRGMPAGSRPPQSVACSTPRSWRPEWPGAEVISSVSPMLPELA